MAGREEILNGRLEEQAEAILQTLKEPKACLLLKAKSN